MITRRSILAILVVALLNPVVLSAAEPADGDVLVFGGTGRLGSEVVAALLAAGHSVTVFARPTSERDRLKDLDVAYVTGDVLVEDDVQRAFGSARFKAVVDALGRGPANIDFYRISQEYIARSAAETGVQHVILHGSVGAGDSWAVYPQERRSRMSALMVEKTAGEKALIDSGVPYTIIRNAILLRHGTPATGNAELFEGEDRYGAVTRADLGRLTAYCMDNEACLNKIYHAVDPTLESRYR